MFFKKFWQKPLSGQETSTQKVMLFSQPDPYDCGQKRFLEVWMSSCVIPLAKQYALAMNKKELFKKCV